MLRTLRSLVLPLASACDRSSATLPVRYTLPAFLLTLPRQALSIHALKALFGAAAASILKLPSPVELLRPTDLPSDTLSTHTHHNPVSNHRMLHFRADRSDA